jgi:uncharacterized protein
MTPEPMRMPGLWHIEYRYSIGEMAALFFNRIRDGVILGAACDGCDRVFVPPKGFCEYCFTRVERVVELSNQGTIEAATVVTAPFPGSPEVPYCIAYVRLGGATSSIANFVKGVALDHLDPMPEQIRVGATVSAVFADERAGRITDFWFEPTAS